MVVVGAAAVITADATPRASGSGRPEAPATYTSPISLITTPNSSEGCRGPKELPSHQAPAEAQSSVRTRVSPSPTGEGTVATRTGRPSVVHQGGGLPRLNWEFVRSWVDRKSTRLNSSHRT